MTNASQTSTTYVLSVRPDADPIDLAASIHHGRIFVRATDEQLARLISGMNFQIATRTRRGQRVAVNIWNDPNSTDCVAVSEHDMRQFTTDRRLARIDRKTLDLGGDGYAEIIGFE